MANSIFIGYELDRPDHNYVAVEQAIRSLGTALHIKTSLWFLSTSYNVESVFQRVRGVQQVQDKLVVIDPVTNSGKWTLGSAVMNEALKRLWT
jgi:hypothetical protein